jgi:hypothetical protein
MKGDHMLKMVAVTAIAVSLMSSQARGLDIEKITGRELYDLCMMSGDANLLCGAYIAGFAAGLVRGEPSSIRMTGGRVCLPRTIDHTHARIVGLRFMRESPEILNKPAADVLTAAMWYEYACEKGPPR